MNRKELRKMSRSRWKDIKKQWKETRKWYSRKAILYYFTKYKLKKFKFYCFHLWYKLTEYEHKHIWNLLLKCLICRKRKTDIDYERLNRGIVNE